MANVQHTQVLLDNKFRTVIKAFRLNDGAGNDTDTVVLDASALVDARTGGDEVLTITQLLWTVGGPTAGKVCKIEWEGATDKEIAILAGNGVWNLGSLGLPALANNATTPTGDISVTTSGFVAGDGYTIIIEAHKSSGFLHEDSSSSSSS